MFDAYDCEDGNHDRIAAVDSLTGDGQLATIPGFQLNCVWSLCMGDGV